MNIGGTCEGETFSITFQLYTFGLYKFSGAVVVVVVVVVVNVVVVVVVDDDDDDDGDYVDTLRRQCYQFGPCRITF